VRIDIDENDEVHFYNEQGEEYRVAVYPIHEARWRALSAWIAIFTLVILFIGWKNRDAIHDLSKQKASVAALEDTNSRLSQTVARLKNTNQSLKNFLLTACVARAAAARNERGQARRNDISAAKDYKRLATLFPEATPATIVCLIPSK
jgi:cell division protein FtsB